MKREKERRGGRENPNAPYDSHKFCYSNNFVSIHLFLLQSQLSKLAKEKRETDQRVTRMEEEVMALKLGAT